MDRKMSVIGGAASAALLHSAEVVQNKVRRDHTLVAIGGGIIQDITCFAASTLLRAGRTMTSSHCFALCSSSSHSCRFRPAGSGGKVARRA